MPREQLMNLVMALLTGAALLELCWAWISRKPVHTFKDTLSSLSLGIGQQAINVFLSASFLAAYVWVHEHLAIGQADTGVWWHWVLFILACDLCYYTGHRQMHRRNFFVAAHVVHHQAEDYNHLSAMRQSWTAWMVVFPFFLPLAIAGVPVEMFAIGQIGIMCIQFLSHNGVFRGRLGPLEKVFVTPANHRVHHGFNMPYLGANCGGMLVIWDRVFGTFVEEDPQIPILMGSGFSTNFYDPIEANLDYYRRIVFVMRHRKGLGKLGIWLQSPRVLIEELRRLDYEGRVLPEPLNRSVLSARGKAVAIGALVATIVLMYAHRLLFEQTSLALSLVTGACVIAGCWGLGRLLSRNRDIELGAVPIAAK